MQRNGGIKRGIEEEGINKCIDKEYQDEKSSCGYVSDLGRRYAVAGRSSGGFKYGGWQGPYFDADAERFIDQEMATTDALLLGRVTYQIFAAYWPNAPADDPIGRRLNSIPKYVWSTTLDKVEWNNSTLMKGDITEEVNRLKQQPGSGVLSVPGSGKRLFAEGIGPIKLKLVDSKRTASGIEILTYQPDTKA